MTTGKPIALTIWTFIGDVISLLYNMLSKFVIAFLPRSVVIFNFMAVVSWLLRLTLLDLMHKFDVNAEHALRMKLVHM